MAHFLALILVAPTDSEPFGTAHQLMKRYWAPDFEDEDGNRDLQRYKCDGFVIGGRFDGVLQGEEEQHNLKPDEFQKRYGLDVIQEINNIQVVSAIPSEVLPYAVITPEGKWFDRDGLAEEKWVEVLHSVLAEYPNHLAVAMDCHC